MRTTPLLFLSFALLAACTKKDDIVEAITGERPACGSDGARVEARINDATWCADATVQALTNEGTVLVTAIGLNTSTLVFSIDEVAVDTFNIQGSANSVLYMDQGITYNVAEGTVGRLVVSSFDPASRRIKGSIDVHLTRESLSGTRRVQAEFDVRASGSPG